VVVKEALEEKVPCFWSWVRGLSTRKMIFPWMILCGGHPSWKG